MPSIHVIYDPKDKISTNPELKRLTGISTAVLTIDEFPETEAQIDSLVSRVVKLLLASIEHD